jgi:1-acyl-sn-glycerol-3-phosphate acyltransferase
MTILGDILNSAIHSWDDLGEGVLGDRWERLNDQTDLSEFGYDAFGYSPEAVKRILPLVAFLYHRYFRVVTKGLENLPEGRVLLVGNHSGQLPFDALMMVSAVLLEGEPPRMIRSMVEKWIPALPFASTFFTRLGQVPGIPANCIRLLNAEQGILVFPEGARGISKSWDKRYQLQPFGQGFMRIALETQTPIVPLALIGAEEQAPSIANLEPLARRLGLPSFPITPFGLIPLPTRYHLHFGEPIRFRGDPNAEDALILRRVNKVKDTIQQMLEEGLRERTHIFR